MLSSVDSIMCRDAIFSYSIMCNVDMLSLVDSIMWNVDILS